MSIPVSAPVDNRRRPRIFYGWWIVAACGAIILIANGTLWYGFAVLVEPIINEFGWSTMATAAAFSLRTEMSAIGGPINGFMADKLGPRRAIFLCVLITALGFLWLSQVHSLLTFYLAFCVIALGSTGTGNQTGNVAVAWWFLRKRSRAMAFLTMGAGFSGLTVPILAWQVTQLGWRNALMIWAVLIVILCVPLTFVVRDRPERYGLLPDGDQPAPKSPSPEAAALAALAFARPERSMTVREALKNRTFWLLSLAMISAGIGVNPAVALLIAALQHVNIDSGTAALALAAIPFLSLPGRIIAGWLGDSWDKRKLLASCLLMQAVGLLILAATTSAWMLIPFVLVFAPSFGGSIPLRPAIQTEYFGPQSIGTIQGLMNSITTIGGFSGPILVGALVDQTGSYQLGFAIVGVLAAVGVPLVLAIRPPQRDEEALPAASAAGLG